MGKRFERRRNSGRHLRAILPPNRFLYIHNHVHRFIPEGNFREATPRDVVEYLSAEARKLSPDKTQINFVWLVPEEVELKPVTMQLRSVPLADVLNYVTQQAGLKYRLFCR